MVELLLAGKSVRIESSIGKAQRLKEEIQSRWDIPVSCLLLSSSGQQLPDDSPLPNEPILVTDFRPLRKQKSIIAIPKTEERGITLKQLQDLMAFLKAESKDGVVSCR